MNIIKAFVLLIIPPPLIDSFHEYSCRNSILSLLFVRVEEISVVINDILVKYLIECFVLYEEINNPNLITRMPKKDSEKFNVNGPKK